MRLKNSLSHAFLVRNSFKNIYVIVKLGFPKLFKILWHRFGMPISSEGKGRNAFSKMRSNPWMISTIVLGLVVLILLFMKAGSGLSAASEKNVAEDVISYL